MEVDNMINSKQVLIVGATSSVGEMIARRLAASGAKLTLLGRNSSRLHQLAEDIGSTQQIIILSGNRDDNYVQDLASANIFDGVVFCYGPPWMSSIIHETYESISKMIDAHFCIPACITSVLCRTGKINHNGGSIVYVSSIAGCRVASNGHTVYGAAKGAVAAFAKGLALELAPIGIRVNSILPGVLLTKNLMDEFSPEDVNRITAMNPLGTMPLPNDVAETTLFLLSSMSSHITGAEIVIDGGYTIR